MRVIAKKILREFWKKHADSEQHLKTWYNEASKAIWNTPAEIKAEYTSASILKNGRAVFNICGNKYRLIDELIIKETGYLLDLLGRTRNMIK